MRCNLFLAKIRSYKDRFAGWVFGDHRSSWVENIYVYILDFSNANLKFFRIYNLKVGLSLFKNSVLFAWLKAL